MLNVKILILALTELTNFSVENNDEKYVWASALNVRSNADIDSEVIAQVRRGEKVKVIERTKKEYEVVDTLYRYFSRYNKESKQFVAGKEVLKIKTFKGRWIKVKSNNKLGFVFDFYLSKLKPIPQFKFPLGADVKSYLGRQVNYTQTKIGCQSCDDNYVRYEDKTKEVTIETGIKGKCGYLGIIMTGVEKSEGELIAFNLYENDINDACNYEIIEDGGRVNIIYYCCS